MAQERFSQFLRRRRRELGLSQFDLGDKSGVSYNYIAKLETDRREPGLNVLKQLALALEIPLDELVSKVAKSPRSKSKVEPTQEFHEFPEKVQDVLLEIGYLIQKIC